MCEYYIIIQLYKYDTLDSQWEKQSNWEIWELSEMKIISIHLLVNCCYLLHCPVGHPVGVSLLQPLGSCLPAGPGLRQSLPDPPPVMSFLHQFVVCLHLFPQRCWVSQQLRLKHHNSLSHADEHTEIFH